jgi:hypothetical protein
MKLYTDPNLEGKKLYEYVLKLIAFNKGFTVETVQSPQAAEIILGHGSGSGFSIAPSFYRNLKNEKYAHAFHFTDRCVVRNEAGEEDLLSTIFYCVNSIQEYFSSSEDPFGRFQFKDSYQKKFGNGQVNLVQQCIDRLCASHPALKKLSTTVSPTKIFLTHDIDTVYGALKEDGFAAVKMGRLDLLLGLALRAVLNRPDWINFDTIMDIEDGYGYRSVFYWLLHRDRMNADYDSERAVIRDSMERVSRRGWESGLHKSLHAETLDEEAGRLRGFSGGNRFHYLNFKLPAGYKAISESVIVLDTSLGFTEQWGFRNNYGLPFMPYDLEEERIYDFVEVPMQIMDRTFYRERRDVKEVYHTLTDWFEANKTNGVLTLNFHNNFFSGIKYTGYQWLYKQLLGYFRDSHFAGISQKEIIDQYYKPEFYR